jgi:hypothetical protein
VLSKGSVEVSDYGSYDTTKKDLNYEKKVFMFLRELKS